MAFFEKTDILLPKNIKDTWAVIACDQFTSDKAYWERVKQTVGDDNSTFNMILPEIYLEDGAKERIENINATMQKYLDEGVFQEYKDSMIFVSRKQSDGLVKDYILQNLNHIEEIKEIMN